MLREEKGNLEKNQVKFKKKLTNLEIENETHENQKRINQEIIREFKSKAEKLSEKLTILQVESE